MAQTTADGRGIITSTRRESAARWRDAWHREQRATDEATTERRGARGVRRRRHGFCWLWPIVAWCPAPVPHACCLPANDQNNDPCPSHLPAPTSTVVSASSQASISSTSWELDGPVARQLAERRSLSFSVHLDTHTKKRIN
jgi:hypothetical protein